jgi:energy-coupling factor transporter ATP-binding protein EcfA2
MDYLSLELAGYKRLALNHIRRIKLVFTEQLQLILGTNGSGKSSLLKELSWLPAVPQDFTKEGYKIIEGRHRGSLYALKSSFSPGTRHSFVKDGTELNPGGTAAVQRELVRQEFGYTPDIHDLFLGLTRFHAMGPGERRSWFLRFSDTNYHYALKKYQDLREMERDITGALKLTHTRLAQETQALISEDQEKQLREEVETLKGLLSVCLDQKTPIQVPSAEILQHQRHRETHLWSTLKDFRETRKKCWGVSRYPTLEALDQALIELQGELTGVQLNIQQISSTIQHRQEMLATLIRTNLHGVQDIDARLAELEMAYAQEEARLRLPFRCPQPQGAYEALEACMGDLLGIFADLPPNGQRLFSRDRYVSVSEQREQLLKQLETYKAHQLTLIGERQHLEHHKVQHEQECPKCQHRWVKGYDEARYQAVCQKIEALAEIIRTLETQLEALTAELEALRSYLTLFKTYADIARGCPVLKPLWDYLTDTQWVFEAPDRCREVLNDLQRDLNLLLGMGQVEAQIRELLQVKTMALKEDRLTTERLQAEIEDLERHLFDFNTHYRETLGTLQQLKDQKAAGQRLMTLSGQLEDLVAHYDHGVEQLVENARKEALNQCIHYLKTELVGREHRLSQIEVQKGLVASLKDQIQELEEQDGVLKIVLKELSPTDGLIARGMLGFINHFVTQMNGFIRKIWLYPLEILPCLPDADNEVDLDYKFPVEVNEDTQIPDVRVGSNSQKEIVDLAFVIVAREYLGLANSPLSLDEFGHTMDAAHRQSAFRAINSLIRYSEISQVFCVSHFSESWGSLSNTEIAVLSETNMDLPRDTVFNRHVTLN